MTWVKRPTKTKVFEYKRKIGSFHPVRQRARSDIAAIYKRIHYEIQKLLKPKGSECNRMEINRYNCRLEMRVTILMEKQVETSETKFILNKFK